MQAERFENLVLQFASVERQERSLAFLRETLEAKLDAHFYGVPAETKTCTEGTLLRFVRDGKTVYKFMPAPVLPSRGAHHSNIFRGD